MFFIQLTSILFHFVNLHLKISMYKGKTSKMRSAPNRWDSAVEMGVPSLKRRPTELITANKRKQHQQQHQQHKTNKHNQKNKQKTSKSRDELQPEIKKITLNVIIHVFLNSKEKHFMFLRYQSLVCNAKLFTVMACTTSKRKVCLFLIVAARVRVQAVPSVSYTYEKRRRTTSCSRNKNLQFQRPDQWKK